MSAEAPRDLGIDGVFLTPLSPHADERGSLTEIYRRTWIPNAGEVIQANLSRSRAGVLRGLHVHRDQADYWIVVYGVAFIGLVDLRQGTPSAGGTAELRVDPEIERVGLYIPPGVAHGFYAESDVTLLYLVDRAYAGDDEFGLAWDDPAVGIEWPVADPLVSDRDRDNPTLADLRTSVVFEPGG